MDTYLNATDVLLTVPLADAAGNPLTVEAIRRRVVDESGAELLADAALAGFNPGDPSAQVAVAAAHNTLAAGATRALRVVELSCTVGGGNTILLKASYALELADPLVEGVNSFQSYALAEFNGLEMVNTPGWDNAGAGQRVAALIEARRHIVQLNFAQLNSNGVWGQDSLNFVPEGSYPTGTASNMFLFNGSLELLTAAQFALLPDKFKVALRLAQVAEADAILGGDPAEDKRRTGLVADFVGESKQVYRASMGLQLPVSRRALGYLSYWVTFAKRIGRA